MPASKNKIITVTVGDISPYDLDVTLAQVAQQIQSLMDQHGPDARLDWDRCFTYPYDHEPSPRFHIRVQRPETDLERLDRIAQEKVNQAQRELREKAQYEILAKKYGKTA